MRPAPDGLRPALSWGLLPWIAVLGLLACGGPAARPDLEPLPETDLGAFEANVQSQLAAARAEVDEALTGGDEPRLATAFGELGRRLHAYELYQAAAASYRNAVALAPDEFRWLYHLGILYQATGELDDAVRLLERARGRRPDDLPTRVRLAEIRIAQGDPAAARQGLLEVLELDPQCALAHFFLGNIANSAGDPAEAIEHYARALELQPQATAVHSPLAVAYSALGDSERAASHLELRGRQVVQLLDPLALELGELHVGAVGRIRRGARAQVEGDLATARDEYARAVAADPSNPEARQSLGTVLAQQGEIEAAIAEYRAALELTGDSALVLANLGGLLVGTPERDEGIRLLERALQLDPTLPKARLALAQTQLERQRPDLARDQYRRILERDAANLEARLGLARALAVEGQASAAADELRQALARDPDSGDAARLHQALGELAAGIGDLEGALAELGRALDLDPELAGARFTRANLLGLAGRYRLAAEDYDRFLAVHPASVSGHLGAATALAMAGDLAAASARLRGGLESTNRDPNLMHALAHLLVTAPDPTVRDPRLALELALEATRRLGSLQAAATAALGLAAVGRCTEAVEQEKRLLAECRRTGNQELAARLQARLSHFEATGSCLEPWA